LKIKLAHKYIDSWLYFMHYVIDQIN